MRRPAELIASDGGQFSKDDVSLTTRARDFEGGARVEPKLDDPTPASTESEIWQRLEQDTVVIGVDLGSTVSAGFSVHRFSGMEGHVQSLARLYSSAFLRLTEQHQEKDTARRAEQDMPFDDSNSSLCRLMSHDSQHSSQRQVLASRLDQDRRLVEEGLAPQVLACAGPSSTLGGVQP